MGPRTSLIGPKGHPETVRRALLFGLVQASEQVAQALSLDNRHPGLPHKGDQPLMRRLLRAGKAGDREAKGA